MLHIQFPFINNDYLIYIIYNLLYAFCFHFFVQQAIEIFIMELELASAKRSSDEQYCTMELGMDSNSSERQSASDDNQILENSDKASESGYVFFFIFLDTLQCLFYLGSIIIREISDTRNKWNKILVLAFALFIILAMTVGVLTVCFTSPKSSM